ncbi:uncharacterized protein [Hoplias malabaricus]|uniref:uncharacterized protein n=1 Tax=Hoplias malabaricus TaxID=27720 RepID=UPI0034627BA8
MLNYPEYTLEIQAADWMGTGLTAFAKAIITVTDSNDNAPKFEKTSREWVIPPINFLENSRGPFPKALVQIKSNKSEEVKITYSITGEGADLPPVGLFTVNRNTGWLYVTAPLDREIKDKYVLQAHAVAAEEEWEASMEFIVNVIDMNDNKPVFTQDTFLGSVPEVSSIGHEFMKVTATDADDPNTENADIRYSIFSQNPVKPNPNMFNINPVTGAIRVSADGLDREKYPEYTLEIQAAYWMGTGLTAFAKAIITVTDSNDNAPKFEKTSYTVSVPENTVGAVVVKMAVTDGDEPQSTAWTAKFRIIRGNQGRVFNVSTGPNKQEGIITTVKPLDFETNPKYTLLVAVENNVPFAKPMPTSTATVTVNVLDVNEDPVFDPEVKEVSVPEDAAVGSQLTVFTATDPDTARAQTVTYRVGADAAGWLSVDGENGVVKVKSPMDRKIFPFFVKDGKYRALILAVDDDQVPATGTGTLLINVGDMNDNVPVIEEKMITVCSKEPAPVLLSVTDKDGTGFAAPFKVELQGESRDHWRAEMDKNGTGIVLSPNTALEQGEYNIVLRVYDNGLLYQDHTVLAAVYECIGEVEYFCLKGFYQDVQVLQFPESSMGLKRRKREWVIPPINFPENDNGPFPKALVQIKSNKSEEVNITYSITGEGADRPPVGLFTINRDTGWLYVTKPVDREFKNKYVLQAHAVAAKGEGEAPIKFIINMIDVNDNVPVFTRSIYKVRVPEATPIGHEFMKVTATDADDPNTENADIRYYIFSQNPVEPNPNMFNINPVTGAIRVSADGLDRENYSAYELRIRAADMMGSGRTSIAKVLIEVTDSNDNAPKFEKTSYTVSVPENTVGAVVVKMAVTDGDEPQTPAWTAKFRIIQGDTSGVYKVSTGPNKQEGIITAVKPLDFETNPKYTLLVVVENDVPFAKPMTTSTATVTVNVQDVNEAPVFDPQMKEVSVPEDTAVGSQLTVFTATDPDTARTQTVMYRVGADAAGWVSVDGETGVVKVKSPMDRESHFVKDGKYRALILAVDDDQVPATGTGTLLINLAAVNSPIIEEKMITVCSKEPAPVLLSVTDKDGPGFAAPFKVELQGESRNYWTAEMDKNGNGPTTSIAMRENVIAAECEMIFSVRLVMLQCPEASSPRPSDTGPDPEKAAQAVALNPEADSSPQLRNTGSDLEKDVLAVADVPVLQFPGSSVGLKRRKRELVIPPINFPENDNGPFPKQIAQIKSSKAKAVSITYSISGGGADLPPVGLFTINRNNGWFSVTKPLDREVKNNYVLQVHAVADEGEGEAPMEIIVNVIDMNDNTPVFTQDTFHGFLSEASAIGLEFMKVTATDADDPNTDNADIRYSIISQNPVEPNPNMFDINPVTGAIRVKAEGLNREKYPEYTLEVQAADMAGRGLTALAKAVVNVTHSNDNAPEFEKTSYTVSLPENIVGAVVVKMVVTDGDEPQTPAWTAKFRIIQGDTSGVFRVSTGPNKQEGIITTVKPLDFEGAPKYTLLVVVENDIPFDSPMNTSTATVTVNVLDVNDPPVFDPQEKVISVPEGKAVDSQPIEYTATDQDKARGQKVMYHVGADAAGWVSVDGETGVVKVKSPMDRESHFVKDGKYRALILAVDDDQVPATGTGTLLINLEDVNDNSPVIKEKMITVCSKEPAPVLLSVTDKDGPGFAAPFKVELQGECMDHWTAEMIEKGTGILLTPKTALNEGKYSITLRVYDNSRLHQDHTVLATVHECMRIVEYFCLRV